MKDSEDIGKVISLSLKPQTSKLLLNRDDRIVSNEEMK